METLRVLIGIMMFVLATSIISTEASAQNRGLRKERAARIAGDADLQQQIDTIELTPGPQGLPGNDGSDGAVGAQGPAGNDGAVGAQGPAGNDGAVGAQGPAGNDGAVGAQGPQGPAGADGTNGTDGTDGATGPAGVDGADGATGLAGADGADGATGPAGSDGTDGTDGVDCANLYDHPWNQFGTDAYYNDGNVGIGTTSPGAKLEVNGEVKIGNSSGTSTAGMIRWTGADFEGYTGTEWVSLTGGAPTGNPVDPETVLLLHMDGNAQSFVDSSASGHNVTVVGNATQTNSNVMTGFGNSSSFDGNGDYLEITDNIDFDFGNGDFTIDFWAYPTNLSVDYVAPLGVRTNGEIAGIATYLRNKDRNNRITIAYHTGNWNVMEGSQSASLNTWQHIALVRYGNNLVLYKDGVNIGFNDVTGLSLTPPSGATIGSDASATYSYMFGYLDEVRISKGIARWTSNFTPPNSPYGD